MNLVTDSSFRARLARITYLDTTGKADTLVRLAIIIEHRDRLAKRISSAAINTERVKFLQLEPAFTNLISVFQYFIGNTDYEPTAPSLDGECCHNHDLFGAEGERYLSVPFDFDMSGFVNAPHAIANPRFRLRNVRQRRYRGRCFNNSYVPTSVGKFIEQRDNIYGLINAQELMTKSTRRAMLKFVDDFFESLDSPEKVKKRLVGNCT